jgi:hypothetical protein
MAEPVRDRPFKARVYRAGREVVVAACDADLVGREFRENGLRLKVEPAFYGTEDTSPVELEHHLRRCTIANLVGEGVVGLAIELGLVGRDHVLWIGGVPHAQLATL